MGRPRWMNDEEYAEYRMTEEYRQEVTAPFEPPEYDYDLDFDAQRADAMAEEEWEREQSLYEEYEGE